MSDAHDEIRNLLGRYCELIDAGQFAGLAELFADGTLADEHGTVFATGADEMLALWEHQTIRYKDGRPCTKHLTVNPVISVYGDKATCTSSYVVFQSTEDFPLQPIITGRYADAFVRDDSGHWRFSQRRYAIDHLGDLSHHLRS